MYPLWWPKERASWLQESIQAMALKEFAGCLSTPPFQLNLGKEQGMFTAGHANTGFICRDYGAG